MRKKKNNVTVLKIVLSIVIPLVVAGIQIYLDYKRSEYWAVENKGMEAMIFFASSLELEKGIWCGTGLSYLGSLNRIENDLEIGSVVDVNNGKYRYEKDSLKGDERLKWGAGVITSEYSKYDSCFQSIKLIEVDDADSVKITKIDNVWGETTRYIGKRQNAIVTECSVCRMENGLCKDTISVERIELNPISGKREKRFYKTKYSDNTETFFYDSLGRLVEVKMDENVYRYEHFTNDSADLDVKMFDKTGRELGFYKRTYKTDERQKTVQYKKKNSNEVVKEIYENGKLKLKISVESIAYGLIEKVFYRSSDDFYRSNNFKATYYDSVGAAVYDSSYSEQEYLSDEKSIAISYVDKVKHGTNGKVEKIVHYEEPFYRSKSKSPWKSLGLKKIGIDEFKFYKGNIENINECKESLNLSRVIEALMKVMEKQNSKKSDSSDNSQK